MSRATVVDKDIAITWDCRDDEKLTVEVYRYGGLLKKISSSERMLFKADADGIYRFVAYKILPDGRRKNYGNEIVEVFSVSAKKKYDCFLDSDIAMLDDPLKCYLYKEPYSDFVICVNMGEIEEFSELGSMVKTVFDEHTLILSNGQLIDCAEGIKAFFSGYAFYQGLLCLGNEDVGKIALAGFNLEGCYTRLMCDEKNISLDNDYFGLSPLYYYQQEQMIVISNHYHLLIKLLNKLSSAYLSINKDFVSESLGAFCGVNEYPFSDDTLFKEIHALSVCQRVEIGNGKVRFIPNELCHDIEEKEDIYPEKYHKYLEKTSGDIVEKLDIIAKDERIREISADLTGGVDSRCVLAALAKIDNKEKFKYFNSSNLEDNEFTIAATLGDIIGIPFDYERRERIHEEDFIRIMKKKISLSMHKRLDPNILMSQPNPRIGKVVMNGADAGFRTFYLNDIVFRGYDFVYHYDSLRNDFSKEDEEVLDVALSKFAICGKKDIEKIRENYRKSLEVWSGNNFQKVEKSYLRRARYHYSPLKEGGYGSLFVSPLLSREIIKLFYSTFGKVDGFKVEFDILFSLNPLLAMHEYKNAQYNKYVLKKYGNYSKVLLPDRKNINNYLAGKKQYEENKAASSEADRLYRVKNQAVTDKATYLKAWCLELIFYIVNITKDKDIKQTMFYPWFFLSEKLPDKVPPLHNWAVYSFFIRISDLAFQIREVEKILDKKGHGK